jgi:Domain of unknown function (DUF4390)
VVKSGRSCRMCNRDNRLRLWCVMALIVASVTLASADGIRITPLVREGQVLVSFEIPNGFTEDVRAAIYSGLRTTFTYTVELRLEAAAWIDRKIATVVISNIVQYDNLSRRHNISRMLDGRIEDTRVTGDEAEVRQYLTVLERMPLFKTSQLEPNREYYVRVYAVARPRTAAFPWPFGSGLSGQSKFTFIR